jgi:hypothetical protein
VAQVLPADEWRSLEGARVTVFHASGQEGVAASVLRLLEEQSPLPALPPDVPSGVSAYLAPDAASFDRLTGGRIPEWGAGVAIPALGRLVLPVYSSSRTLGGDRARVLRHEWAHLGLAQHLGVLRAPRWFDEGYAEWAAGWDRSEAWRLRLLLASGRAPPLDSLTLDWPRDAASARAAYLLSATALEYLVSESGERGLTLFLERWKQVGSFEEALRSTYGVTTGAVRGALACVREAPLRVAPRPLAFDGVLARARSPARAAARGASPPRPRAPGAAPSRGGE